MATGVPSLGCPFVLREIEGRTGSGAGGATLEPGSAPAWIAAYVSMTKGVAALGCPFVLRGIEGNGRATFGGRITLPLVPFHQGRGDKTMARLSAPLEERITYMLAMGWRPKAVMVSR